MDTRCTRVCVVVGPLPAQSRASGQVSASTLSTVVVCDELKFAQTCVAVCIQSRQCIPVCTAHNPTVYTPLFISYIQREEVSSPSPWGMRAILWSNGNVLLEKLITQCPSCTLLTMRTFNWPSYSGCSSTVGNITPCTQWTYLIHFWHKIIILSNILFVICTLECIQS
jgi:hypothetical protein